MKWHRLADYTYAMNVPTGVLVRYRGDTGVALCSLSDTRVAQRWRLVNESSESAGKLVVEVALVEARRVNSPAFLLAEAERTYTKACERERENQDATHLLKAEEWVRNHVCRAWVSADDPLPNEDPHVYLIRMTEKKKT